MFQTTNQLIIKDDGCNHDQPWPAIATLKVLTCGWNWREAPQLARTPDLIHQSTLQI